MTFNGLKHLFFAAACLFLSRTMPAQTLPQLPADATIRQGKLGCGAAYYMVVNPADKGHAYLAVVQLDSLNAQKQHELNPALLARMGILPDKEGFLSQQEGNTFYRIPRVPVFRSHALDSTLLHTFAQMALCREPQAVVISGDIDPVELKKKMDIFSMMVPRLGSAPERPPYEWVSTPAPNMLMIPGGQPSVKAGYASARIPREQMNTAQALVTDMFAREFEVILRHRLERNLKEEGVPWRSIRFFRTGSGNTAGDERYSVQIATSTEFIPAANTVLGRTLAELGEHGVSTQEYADAKQILLPAMLERAASAPSNRESADRCIAHFLYGATLAPFSEETRLFSRKNVSEEMEAQLFNGFSSALLQQLSNLTLTCKAAPDSLDGNEVLFRYNLAWLQGYVDPWLRDHTWHSADTLWMEKTAPAKVRIKAEKAEPLSGGTLWTFSNGIRVAYKQLKGSGMFHYALQLNGGLSQIPNLKEGEGGYIADILPLMNPAGFPARTFRDMLAANGIGMETHVELNSMDIRGKAPSDKLSLLLKALAVLADERSLNQEELDAFLRNEALRTQPLEDRLASLISPHYQYASGKWPEALSAETAVKAEQYFKGRFSRINDGILILSGDLDPGVVKKLLQRQLGAFHTVSTQTTTPRKQVHFRTLSGTTTYSEEGYERGLYVLLDADYPLTAMNYLSSKVAKETVREVLAHHLADAGLSANVSVSFIAHPQERLRMLISCTPTEAGLDLMPSIGLIRKSLQELSAHQVNAKDLESRKQQLAAQMQQALSRPEDVVLTLLARYAIGKDLTSRYKENISAITAERVSEMLKALATGGCIEYIAP